MRIVITIDGELLTAPDPEQGIVGQRKSVEDVVSGLGDILCADHEIVMTHGNAPQIGFMLLRAEVAQHLVYPLSLDICGSDTQGATGYMLQQGLLNWMQINQQKTDVVTLVTQVVVNSDDPAFKNPSRGIGPFYDKEKAQLYAATKGWHFVVKPGCGYRRAVPAPIPKRIVEVSTIKKLIRGRTIVICGGGGGVPVTKDSEGLLRGVEAVVDKAYTTSLLACEVEAQRVLFVSCLDALQQVFGNHVSEKLIGISLSNLDVYIEQAFNVNESVSSKLVAGKQFLRSGGEAVLIAPYHTIAADFESSKGVLITR